MIGSRGPSAPLGSPGAALNMEALLQELSQLNDLAEELTEAGRYDEWDVIHRRRQELMAALDKR